ncbi:uncharacterized protein V1516DRAFT_644614 [Lipomyces oligophaga]|uniref:uncharacterized protein n=1 Tax=Lipomyces oligophaga TaxID=45792 RepID=UPI0034CFAB03
MLEGLVASLLNRFLGAYVKNFDPKQLNIGIWSGDVKLRKLELKREALDKFRLPIDVVEGYLGDLTLQIPWSNLKNKPVKVIIENVYVLAVPKANQEYDEAEEERRKQLLKMERLEDLELLTQAQPDAISPEEQKKNQSFTESLVTKIIDNLQITIRNLHFRYEDTISAPEHPFSLGITLTEFSAVSTDSAWNPIFIQDNALETHKLSRLESLAVYWNTDSELISERQGPDVITQFVVLHEKFVGKDISIRNQYILKPVSGQGRIAIHKGSATEPPNSKAELIFDEIGFVLDEYQYRDALMMVDLFHFYVRTEQFKSLRPKVTVAEDPKQWFQFAGNVVLREIHEKHRQWSWEFFKEHIATRKRYIELYKIRAVADPNSKLTDAETEELGKLEWKLSFDDLKFYRSLAKSELRKERRKLATIQSVEQVEKPAEPAQKAGWFSWAWGSGTTTSVAKESEEATVMTEQQRKELYDAIEWDEDQKPISDTSFDLPRDAVKMQLKISLGMGSFALKRDPRGEASEILKLLFDTFSLNYLQRPDSFLMDLTLMELNVHDGTKVNTLYPDIVRVKKPSDELKERPRLIELDSSDSVDDVEDAVPFFYLSFEKNPLDESADSSMIMKVGSMEIYYNKVIIEEIAQFFKPPKSHMESFGALLYAAGATIEGITNSTRAGLEYALQEHKTLNANLNIQAPLLILPSSMTERNAPCMVLDAGHVNIVSNLVDKNVIRDIQNKQSSAYVDDDYETLKSLMYDRFQLNLEDTQVLVGPNVEETIAQLYASTVQHKEFHIVDKINMSLLVEISIVAQTSNLTKLRVSAHLPVLHVSISDVKYKTLMHLINTSVPKLSFVDEDDLSYMNMPLEDSEEATSQTNRRGSTASQRGRSPLFTFNSSLEENKGISMDDFVDDDDDDDDADTFVDTEETIGPASLTQSRGASAAPEVNLNQRTFEFNFKVDKMQGSLYRGTVLNGENNTEDEFGASHQLVDIILDNFDLMFYTRAFDMHAEIILGQLTVEDKIDPNPLPEFSRLISSSSFYDKEQEIADIASTDRSKSNLFHITYSKVQKDSPEYLSSFEGIDQNVELLISTLNFVITRKSILTLMAFIPTMFSSDETEEEENALIELNEDDSETEIASTIVSADGGPDKMKLKFKLSSIVLTLNDDGVRLSTIRIDQADIGIFTMGKTMRVGGRIGNFLLQDHLTDELGHSYSNQLVSIQGDELADFRYETFDPRNPMVYPGYNSSIYFRSGSIKINFVEESFQSILLFLEKFAEMKTLYDSARQAAVIQASQMKDPDKIHFDVIVRTPIFVFSRPCPFDSLDEGSDSLARTDVVIVHLGELYIENVFSTLKDENIAGPMPSVNKINAGLRQTRITSKFHFPDNVVQELQMIDNLDISFKMVYVEHRPGLDRPALEIVGSMSDVNLNLTESEYIFFINFLKNLSSTFQSPPEQIAEVSESRAIRSSSEIESERATRRMSKSISISRRGSVKDQNESKGLQTLDVFTKIDFVFRLQTLSLELFNDTNTGTVTSNPATLSKLALSGTDVKLKMMSDEAVESEFHVRSFTIVDSRQNQKNRFREIVPSIKHDGYQFMASISTMQSDKGGTDVTAVLSIDSPRFIFAIDYLFALKRYFVDSLQTEEDYSHYGEEMTSDSEDYGATSSEISLVNAQTPADNVDQNLSVVDLEQEKPEGSLSFRINVVDASVILIANPLTSSSEAIVLRIKEILLTQQNVFTMTLNQVGIYLCRMDLFEENRLRILDDFNAILSIDNNYGRLQHKTFINAAVDALVLRISLRDILLVLSIVNKASELSPEQAKPMPKRPYSRFSTNKRLKQFSKGPSRKNPDNGKTGKLSTQVQAPKSGLLQNEQLSADFDGLRLVLIGSIHELPLLDMCIKQFPIHVRNWSTEMDADTSVEMFVNVYNYSRSAWEPLIEPWYLGFHMTRTIDPPNLSVNFNSRRKLELTVTSQTIAILSNAVDMVASDSDLLSKPPDANAPYRIKNQTGYALSVWVDDTDNPTYSMAKEIADGEEVPWRFDDWRKLRENLSDDSQHGTIGVRLKDTQFDAVTRIQATKEGETLYVLQPKAQKVAHRLVCEVKLREDKVKNIILRSALLIENATQIPIHMKVGEGDVSQARVIEIVPGDSYAVPIHQLYDQSIKIRPLPGLGFKWCEEKLYWKDMLQWYSPYLNCLSKVREPDEEQSSFYFQVCALYDKNEPLARLYPHMRIRLCAPLEVQNLLPYDFNFSIYDKRTRREWSNFLRKGLLSPVHVAKLDHLLMLSVHMRDSGFDQSQYAVINSGSQVEYRREYTVASTHRNGQKLRLNLHFYEIPESGGSFRVSIYCPYVILNETSVNLQLKSGSVIASSKYREVIVDGDDSKRRAIPMMFSYLTNDRSNRVAIRTSGSVWSSPQSFEAVGSDTDVMIPSDDGRRETHFGIHVGEGQGKYKMTKVVTITPRFVLHNKLSEVLILREPGSSVITTINAGEVLPLHFMQKVPDKQLTLSFADDGSPWSAPFNISDYGRTHVKVAKVGSMQRLLKVDILIEQATIFLHIGLEKSNWPYSLRNFSNTEFTFYQANPYITYDDDSDNLYNLSNSKRFRPITYRLPKKSVMSYAWDYPAAVKKELVICANGIERHVPLGEIGDQVPLKINGTAQVPASTIDINVVADGPIQTLVLSDYDQSRSLYKPKLNISQSSVGSGSANSSSTAFEPVDDDSDVTVRIGIYLEGIGISLVNTRMQELAYITFRGLEFKYNESAIYQTIITKMKWLQIDNMLYGGIYPIVLYPTVLPQTTKEMDSHPTLSMSFTRVKDESHGVYYVKFATILLQEMTVEIDEDFLFAVLDFSKVPGASWWNSEEDKLCDDILEIPEPAQEESGQDMYFEVLSVQPAQINLSFVRTERVNVEDKTSSANALMFFLNILTMAIGNINDAPVKLNALVLENARLPMKMLTQLMAVHYRNQLMLQVHNILGSADFIGNPVGLFTNISSGVMDIFYEPYQGYIMNDRPQEFGIGLARGGFSFLRKSVFGVSDSIMKVTGSISKGLAVATMDKQFQDRRRISRRRNKPAHALYGVAQGANSFVEGLASGVSGLALAPMKGASEEGAAGFFKGLGKGLIGLPTKTATGLLDLASNVSEGIRNTTTVFDAQPIDRVRLPRYIGRDRTCKPYNQREALGQMWLKEVNEGDYFEEEYVAHVALPGEELVVIVTYKRILLIDTRRLVTQWDVQYGQLEQVVQERGGIGLVLLQGTPGPFIPVVDEEARQYLYAKIGMAVNDFNEYRQAMV